MVHCLRSPCPSFNSRSPSGLRPTSRADCKPSFVFQFTQPKRAATSKRDIALWPTRTFQFTQPKRAATTVFVCDSLLEMFQFTQPKRAATGVVDSYLFDRQGVNSRSPSGLRLTHRHGDHAKYLVSIHAAQAGCDLQKHRKKLRELVSIHAAQAGCDLDSKYIFFPVLTVSIHAAQAGCDNYFKASGQEVGDVSIHAAQAGCDLRSSV